MTHFRKLELTTYENLLTELNKVVEWDKYNQICLNAPVGQEDNHQAGQGSLIYDWDRGERVWNEEEGTHNWVVPKRDVPLKEEDFTETTECFRGTVFEDLLLMLKSKYDVGRVRIMKLAPKTCLSWHVDDTARIHYPFKTHDGCKMIIEDEVCDLTQDQWWWAETTLPHTAINASREPRLHIVAVVL